MNAPAVNRVQGRDRQAYGREGAYREAGRREAGYRDGMRDRREFQGFRDRDFYRFSDEDRRVWIGGRWNNTCFGGRCGWWWFAGGQWYFYTAPVYPYPLVVADISYAAPVAPYVPPPVQASLPPQPLSIAPPPQFWYYCDNPAGYYPSVQACSTGFRQVAAPPQQ
jgi:hypothetical protein